MKLVIVESPTKAKTISRFLEKDYKVLSSYGHVRDLPIDRLAVDVQNDFKPEYIVPEKAQKNVAILKRESARAQEIILATDEDLEGEAIAYHLKHILSEAKKGQKFSRITFHEITEKAILEALKSPRGIDLGLFDAQQARRVLDRLVGYELSPFLWRKIRKGLSAGRVQSVAVRLIVEREREREAFKPEEYWKVKVLWSKKGSGPNISQKVELVKDNHYEENKKLNEEKATNGNALALLSKIGDKKLDNLALKKEAEVKKILNDLEGLTMVVKNIEKKKSFRTPPPPFRTSTLQQEIGRRLGFTAKRTMRAAQQLYE